MWLLMISVCGSAAAQTEEEINVVARTLGVMNAEDADHEEFEDMIYLLRHPLDINRASRSELESVRLFSQFQIASLLDYRERHGCIMSMTELSSVDGFGSQKVQSLKPFIVLEPVMTERTGERLRGELNGRTSLKMIGSNSPVLHYSIRGKLSCYEKMSINMSVSREYDSPRWSPSSYSAAFTWTHRYGKVLVGDFNARFGQGLCMWNSSFLSVRSSPSSYMRRATGISPSYSYNSAYPIRGLAADFRLKRWKLSCFAYSPDLKDIDVSWNSMIICPAANITRYFRFGHMGITHYVHFSDLAGGDFRIPQMKSSYDFSVCVDGVNLFGETMYDWVLKKPAALAGMETSFGEYFTFASMARFLPLSDEHGASVSGEVLKNGHDALLYADVVYHPQGRSGAEAVQIKTQGKWEWHINDVFCTELRISERIRTWERTVKTDVRTDLNVDSGDWEYSCRFNISKSKGIGLLGYVEVSYVFDDLVRLYLRQGFFGIDNWDDRIYVYERDAPGNFNVPAFYGRGLWSSVYVSWKFARCGSLYVRASYTSYAFMRQNKKPGKAELKLQFLLHL